MLDHLQDDRSTLYKCLFVNRLFCKIIIPILYKKPFHNIKDHLHYYFLINTFFACFNEKERLYLVQNDININNKSSTLFEYGRYLESVCYDDLNFSVDYWFLYQFYDINQNQKSFLMKIIIGTFTMMKNVNVIWLEIHFFIHFYDNLTIQNV